MTADTTRNPNLDRRSPSVAAQGAERWRTNLGRDEVRFPRDASWWTGRSPADPGCPGRRPDGTVTSLSTPNLATCTRDEVQAYFENTWVLTEILFAGLVAEEAFFRPPYHNLRHPFIFYYTHPPALYVNKLRVAGLVERPLNALLRAALRDRRRRDELGRPLEERDGVAEHLRVPRLPPAGLRAGLRRHRRQPRARRRPPSDRPRLAALGPLHGLRARAHPPRDLVGPHPRAAPRAGAPPGGVPPAPSDRPDRRRRRDRRVAGPPGRPDHPESARRGARREGLDREGDLVPELRLGQRVRLADGRRGPSSPPRATSSRTASSTSSSPPAATARTGGGPGKAGGGRASAT